MNKKELIKIINDLPEKEIVYFHYAPKIKSQIIKVDFIKKLISVK